jgi:IMP dehydrogenase/GMP reductase
MNHSTVAAIVIFIAVASGSAHADTVTDWNQTAIQVIRAAGVSGAPGTRSLAMMHAAMSDAINSVQGRYTRYIATVAAVPAAPNPGTALSQAKTHGR